MIQIENEHINTCDGNILLDCCDVCGDIVYDGCYNDVYTTGVVMDLGNKFFLFGSGFCYSYQYSGLVSTTGNNPTDLSQLVTRYNYWEFRETWKKFTTSIVYGTGTISVPEYRLVAYTGYSSFGDNNTFSPAYQYSGRMLTSVNALGSPPYTDLYTPSSSEFMSPPGSTFFDVDIFNRNYRYNDPTGITPRRFNLANRLRSDVTFPYYWGKDTVDPTNRFIRNYLSENSSAYNGGYGSDETTASGPFYTCSANNSIPVNDFRDRLLYTEDYNRAVHSNSFSGSLSFAKSFTLNPLNPINQTTTRSYKSGCSGWIEYSFYVVETGSC